MNDLIGRLEREARSSRVECADLLDDAARHIRLLERRLLRKDETLEPMRALIEMQKKRIEFLESQVKNP